MADNRVFERTSTSIRWPPPPPSLLALSTGLVAPRPLSHDHKMSPCSPQRSRHVLALLFFFISCLPTLHAQTISTNMPVPPLQWIELTDLLTGSAAPPLKDATIGFDDTNRILLIFGGESQQGFPTSQTYTYVPYSPSLTTTQPSLPYALKFGSQVATMVDSKPTIRLDPGTFN